MKYLIYSLLLFLFIVACQSNDGLNNSQNLKIELEEFDYFESSIPFSKTKYENKENHDQIASLGRILFYDNRLSQNNSISCANCHNQQSSFSDNVSFSRGLENYSTLRNSMTLTNNAYQISQFWVGEQGSIEDHILSPISNHIEMGMRNIDELVSKLSGIEDYNRLFNEVFQEPISEELIEESLSTFVASIISYRSKFDLGKEIDFTNFTLSELTGKELFFGKALCGECHQGKHYSASWRRSANIGLDLEYEDQGSGNGRFKIPTLRNISLTSPYMHDGRFETLEEVVDHYTDGIKDHPHLDWTLQHKIDLSELEKEMLVDFLHTLTDYEMISEEKFSNPFN